MTGLPPPDRRRLSLWQRLRLLLPFAARPPQLALPAPEQAAVPVVAPLPTLPEPQPLILTELVLEPANEAPDEGAPAIIPATPPAPPALETAEPEPGIPPMRRRVVDPARRSRYFSAPYVDTSRTRLLASPAVTGGFAAPSGLPLAAVATMAGPPPPPFPGRVDWIEPIGFSAFALWHPEHAPVPPDATLAWLLEPVLLARAIRLRDAVVHNYAAGGPPIDPGGLFEAARRIAGHDATALLLCLTVSRTFARGGDAVPWRIVDRRLGSISDGVETHLPRQRHSGGVAQPDGAEAPGLFHLLLDPAAFGTADPGDWVRFFGLATLVALTAGRGCAQPQAIADGAAARLALQVDAVAAAMLPAALDDGPAARSWRWANALSLVEWGDWGRSAPRALAAAEQGIAAARFGLAAAGQQPDPSWRWTPPVAGFLRTGIASSASIDPLAARMRISRTTLVSLLALAGAGRRDGSTVTVICTVDAGIACRLATGGWDDPALAAIAPRLIGEIGWKSIEHARSRTVIVRCAIMGDDAHAECQIDLGGGFENFPVTESGNG